MFKSDFAEAIENKITITAFEPDVVKQLITFIYEDKVDEEAVTWELYNAAKMYEVNRLQQLCLRGLRKKLDLDTCCEMLKSAFVHDLDEIFDFAIVFLKKNKEGVSQTNEWQELVKEYPDVLAKIILRGI
jgi:hypothetical protein